MRKQGFEKTRALPTAFDCFAGCGGMTTGFRKADYRVLGAIEIDPQASDVYELNHPEVRLWRRDIRRVTAEEILNDLAIQPGELDLLGGCPPCQGFSTLRTYNGNRRIHDSQNDLIFEFQRLVLALKPKNVMLENVPALLQNRRLREFREALEGEKYAFDAEIFNVADFGVPQRRKRLVALASKCGTVQFAAKSERWLTVRETIEALPLAGDSGDPLHDMKEKRSSRTRRVISAIPKDGGSRSALPKNLQLECHKKSDGFKDVYGRMAWDKPAPTITTGCFNPSKGRFLHPTFDRAITLREAALLQSFPADYQFPADLGKVRIATMIGNALPPEFIRHHAAFSIGRVQNEKSGEGSA